MGKNEKKSKKSKASKKVVYPDDFREFLSSKNYTSVNDINGSYYFKTGDERNYVVDESSYNSFREIHAEYPDVKLKLSKKAVKTGNTSLDNKNNVSLEKSFPQNPSFIISQQDPNFVYEGLVNQIAQMVDHTMSDKDWKESISQLQNSFKEKETIYFNTIQDIRNKIKTKKNVVRSKHFCDLCSENTSHFYFICLRCPDLKFCNTCQENNAHQKSDSNKDPHLCRIVRIPENAKKEEINKLMNINNIKKRLSVKKRQDQIKQNAVKYASKNMLSNEFCEKYIRDNQDQSPEELIISLRDMIN